jgi:hypothetical protein
VTKPGTTHVEKDEGSSTKYRENGHRFSCTVDGSTPLLTEQKENGRNQRSCVTNTDPPYEVGNIPGPADGLIQTPYPDPNKPGVHNAENTYAQKKDGNCESNDPTFGRPALNLTTDVVCDVRPGFSTIYERLS